MLHGTTIKDADDFFATIVERKVASCNRSLATNFGIGEALRIFDPAAKTRHANNLCHVRVAKCTRTKYKNKYCQQCYKLMRVTCQRKLTTIAKKIIFKNRTV